MHTADIEKHVCTTCVCSESFIRRHHTSALHRACALPSHIISCTISALFMQSPRHVLVHQVCIVLAWRTVHACNMYDQCTMHDIASFMLSCTSYRACTTSHACTFHVCRVQHANTRHHASTAHHSCAIFTYTLY